MFTLDAIGDLAVDRTGQRVAASRFRWERGLDRRRRDLWLFDTRLRTETRLTATEADEESPTFSPDGAWIYFKRNDTKGVSQVWRIAPDGSREQAVTQLSSGPAMYQLSGDGRSLWYVTHDDQAVDDPWAGLRKRFGALTYGHAPQARSTVWRLDLTTWRTEKAFEAGAWAYELSVTDDGRRVALVTAPDDELLWREGWSDVVIWDRASGQRTELDDAPWRKGAPSPYGWLIGLSWSDDGQALAWHVDYDGFPGETYVAELAGGTVETWKVPRPREVHWGAEDPRWVPDKRELCQVADERGRRKVVCVDDVRSGDTGRDRTFPEGDVVVRQFAFSGDGRDVVAEVATPERFGELYRLPARGQTLPVRLTDLNPHTTDWRLPKLQVVTWKATDGTSVEGILETPWGWTADQGPLPTYVVIHGGPSSYSPYARAFRVTGETWATGAGFAVFLPNYRGSISFGDAFLTALIGHENDRDVDDILTGVDSLVARGVADPQKLAVGGWSNGGYLTGCVITATDRFKAAILGAGVFDQATQWITEDTPGHVVNYMQGLPWEKKEAYQAASPLYRADRIVTPTLVHVGEDDPRVPLPHAEAVFRALDVYRKIPVELIVYPDTGHGLRKMSHVEAKMGWDRAWLERWVLGVTGS